MLQRKGNPLSHPQFLTKEFHKYTLDDEPFEESDLASNFTPLTQIERDCSFVFHGVSGTGKSSMIETLCGVTGISGLSDERNTDTRSYFVALPKDGPTPDSAPLPAIQIHDTPGLGESEEFLDRPYKGMDQVVDSFKNGNMVGQSIQQIYFFIPSQGRNFEANVVNNVKALQLVYGEECTRYLTLVQSQSDRLKLQPCHEVTGLRKRVQDALHTEFGHPFKILYVASKANEVLSNACFIQLTQDMLNHSLEDGFEPSKGLLYRDLMSRLDEMEDFLSRTIADLKEHNRVLIQKAQRNEVIKIGTVITLVAVAAVVPGAAAAAAPAVLDAALCAAGVAAGAGAAVLTTSKGKSGSNGVVVGRVGDYLVEIEKGLMGAREALDKASDLLQGSIEENNNSVREATVQLDRAKQERMHYQDLVRNNS